MTDRPIIFSAPMVRALLDGRKTQTRRIISADIPDGHFVEHCHFCASGWGLWERGPWAGGGRCTCREVKGIRFREGDRLWVRENHRFAGGRYNDGRDGEVHWSEDEWFRCYGGGGAGDNWDPAFPPGWGPSRHMQVVDLTGPGHDEGPDVERFATKVLPSIHMPRWASRLTLVVTDVRVERLQDISEADAIAEGIDPLDSQFVSSSDRYEQTESGGQCVEAREVRTRRPAFERLWNSINGPEAWAANPWVAAVSFIVHQANIDELLSEVAA